MKELQRGLRVDEKLFKSIITKCRIKMNKIYIKKIKQLNNKNINILFIYLHVNVTIIQHHILLNY